MRPDLSETDRAIVRALLDRACAKRDNLGERRTMERQFRGNVSCSRSYRVSINKRGQAGSAGIAPRSESPGFTTVEPRETSGMWNGMPSGLAVSNNSVTVTVAAATAALVQIR